MTLLAEANGAAVHHSTWADLVPVVEAAGGCDLNLVDAPYSARTHGGHDEGTDSANRLVHRGKVRGREQTDRDIAKCIRRPIDYAAWTAADVAAYVEAWAPLTRGWFVSVTDHVLAPSWEAALTAAGRYAFAPIPFVAPGSRIRLSGDGPSCWVTWVIVARPRSREFAGWGALPGGYVLPEGMTERQSVVGGKPTWLGRQLVAHYSRPGDLVVDPCCGAGTFPVSAIREGRRAIGGDMNLDHARMAADWISEAWAKSPKAAAVQPALFGGGL